MDEVHGELDHDLAALAPRVDSAAARRSFDGIRARRRRRHHIVTGALCTLAAVGLVGGLSALTRDDDQQVDVGGATELGPVEFEVLAVNESPNVEVLASQLGGGSDANGLRHTWIGAGLGEDVPDVDLDKWVVVSFVVDNGCAELIGMERREPVGELGDVAGDRLLVPEFTPSPCDGPSGPRAFVVAVDRAATVPGFRLRVPASDGGGSGASFDHLVSPVQYDYLSSIDVDADGPLLLAAVDETAWIELCDELETDGERPVVDFDQRIVVALRVPEARCDRFETFVPEAGHLVAVWHEPVGCTSGAHGLTSLIALSRAGLAPGATLESFGEILRVDVESPAASDQVTFEVLAAGEATDPMGTVRAATTEADYRRIWATSLLGGEPPPVDVDEQVVVSITIPDDACPPELTGFDRDGDTITPVFVEPEGGCILPLIARTFVVALDRAPLEPGFTLLLPGQDQYGFRDSSTVVHLSGPPPTPTCSALETFDEQLDSLGTAADFSPTSSPRALLEPDVVIAIRGRLTGGSTTAQLEGDTWSQAIEIEAVDLVYSPPTVSLSLPERLVVELDIGPDGVPASPVPAGTEVLVVDRAEGGHWAPFGIRPADEGFAFACEGGPLLGRVGTEGEWAEIDSLDELADDLRG